MRESDKTTSFFAREAPRDFFPDMDSFANDESSPDCHWGHGDSPWHFAYQWEGCFSHTYDILKTFPSAG